MLQASVMYYCETGAAVCSGSEEQPRIDALVAAGVDVLCIDERNGSTAAQVRQP